MTYIIAGVLIYVVGWFIALWAVADWRWEKRTEWQIANGQSDPRSRETILKTSRPAATVWPLLLVCVAVIGLWDFSVGLYRAFWPALAGKMLK